MLGSLRDGPRRPHETRDYGTLGDMSKRGAVPADPPPAAELLWLSPHPAGPPSAPFRCSVRLGHRGGSLWLRYRVEGAEALRIPEPLASPGVRHLLWRHTCFEAFVAGVEGPAYFELNLSPSGEWAAYGFRGYREGEPLPDDAVDPAIRVARAERALELEAEIGLAALDARLVGAPLRLGLSAVLEDRAGALSYWALRHPRAQADFHDEAGFAARLVPGPDDGGEART